MCRIFEPAGTAASGPRSSARSPARARTFSASRCTAARHAAGSRCTCPPREPEARVVVVMIPREILAALRTIEIHTARLANEQLSGTYKSSFKGQGLAFREVRPYQPGDDVRTIDWNVS